MNVITIVILAFSIVGALDFLFGNKIGVGKEFEKAFSLFGPMALSMLGMIVLSPAIGVWLTPLFEGFYNVFGIDPSVIPASLFANDMGGLTLAQTISKSEAIGNYNAFVISSMMGCLISFTIPFSLGIVKEGQRKDLFLGFLCGIVTIPLGSFVAGIMCKLPTVTLLVNLLPLVVLALIVVTALLLFPEFCIKCFTAFGIFVKILATIGLVCAIFTFLTKIKLNRHFDTLENSALVCVNACVTLSGALPFMYIVAKLLNTPLNKLASKLGVNSVSMVAFLGSLVTNASTFGIMDKMDKKGTVLNSAFSVSASFVFGSHLAFTMVFDPAYLLPVITAKLISGVSAVILAVFMYKKVTEKDEKIKERCETVIEGLK